MTPLKRLLLAGERPRGTFLLHNMVIAPAIATALLFRSQQSASLHFLSIEMLDEIRHARLRPA